MQCARPAGAAGAQLGCGIAHRATRPATARGVLRLRRRRCPLAPGRAARGRRRVRREAARWRMAAGHEETRPRRGGAPINLKERGSATIWGVALMGLLMTVATAFATVGSVRVASHRVNSAADLSALAAAKLAMINPADACARAAALATQNGVELTRCQITNEIADVWTALPISLPLLGKRTLTGRARAGPAVTTP
ncbi:Rv3654c family TadE-like protein [Nonomuraea sp. B19D2]|uniref:Rv3654c family TadE-like protein n=1 Tax=Nonomuraea sp. B19D2 TaxID=3159561 RepID=UPI0032DA2D10